MPDDTNRPPQPSNNSSIGGNNSRRNSPESYKAPHINLSSDNLVDPTNYNSSGRVSSSSSSSSSGSSNNYDSTSSLLDAHRLASVDGYEFKMNRLEQAVYRSRMEKQKSNQSNTTNNNSISSFGKTKCEDYYDDRESVSSSDSSYISNRSNHNNLPMESNAARDNIGDRDLSNMFVKISMNSFGDNNNGRDGNDSQYPEHAGRNPNNSSKSLHMHESLSIDLPLELLMMTDKYPKAISRKVLARMLGGKYAYLNNIKNKGNNSIEFGSPYMSTDDTSSNISEVDDGGYVPQNRQQELPASRPTSSSAAASNMNRMNKTPMYLNSFSELDHFNHTPSPHRPISANDLHSKDPINDMWPSLVPPPVPARPAAVSPQRLGATSRPSNYYHTTVQDYIDDSEKVAQVDDYINYKDIVAQQQLLHQQVRQQQEIIEILKRAQLSNQLTSSSPASTSSSQLSNKSVYKAPQKLGSYADLPTQAQPMRSKSAFSLPYEASPDNFSVKSGRTNNDNSPIKDPSPIHPKPIRPANSYYSSPVSYSHPHSPIESLYSGDVSEKDFRSQSRPISVSGQSAYSSSSAATSVLPPRIFIHTSNPQQQQMFDQQSQIQPPFDATSMPGGLPYGSQPAAYPGGPYPIMMPPHPVGPQMIDDDEPCQCSECMESASHIYSSTELSTTTDDDNDDDNNKDNTEVSKPVEPPKKPFYKKPKNLIMIAGLLGMGLKVVNAMEKRKRREKEQLLDEKLKKEMEEKEKKDKEGKDEITTLPLPPPPPLPPVSQSQQQQQQQQPPRPPPMPIAFGPPPQPHINYIQLSSYCGVGDGQNGKTSCPPPPPPPAPAPKALPAPPPNDCTSCSPETLNYILHGTNTNVSYLGPCQGYPQGTTLGARGLSSSSVGLATRGLSNTNGNSGEKSSFTPPNPIGYAPYTFSLYDIRLPLMLPKEINPIHTFPKLYINSPTDPILIGTILALHNPETDCLLQAETQYQVYPKYPQPVCGKDTPDHVFTRWQVLPAHGNGKLQAGAKIAYGYQIRLRQINMRGHLYSHYKKTSIPEGGEGNEVMMVHDPTDPQNPATVCSNGYDESDHWVVESYGNGKYGKVWKASDKIVLRHHVSGLVLRLSAMPYKGIVNKPDAAHRPYCSGRGHTASGDKSDLWEVVPVKPRQFDRDRGGEF
ncbi:hypothetical protein H4219_003264 [Mycoemilia scoparia]|uniref:Uncharacterized protein n=1 Tax=Mycoemilia scoparia TaxID=417184 RepID=A0A9W8DSX8_9FUNG|nr:hypothetical protein H4219_003264 [Mycoemilia scoparia]